MSYYEGFGLANPAIATENVFDGGIVAHDAPANPPSDDSLFEDGASADSLDIFGGGFQEAVGGMGAADYSQALAGVRPQMYSGVGSVPSRVYSGMGAVRSRVYSGFGLDAAKFDVDQIWAWFAKSQEQVGGKFTGAANAAGKKWGFYVKAALAQLGFGIKPTQEQYEGEAVTFGNDGIAALKAWRTANKYSSPFPFLDPRTKGTKNDELVLMKKQLEAGQQVGPEKPVSYDIQEQPGAIVVATPSEQPAPQAPGRGLTIPGGQEPPKPVPTQWLPPPRKYQEPSPQVFPAAPQAQMPGWTPSAAQMPGWSLASRQEEVKPSVEAPKLEEAPKKLTTANMVLIGGAALAVGIAAFALFAKKAPAKSEPAAMTPNKRGKKHSKKAHHRKARKSHKSR